MKVRDISLLLRIKTNIPLKDFRKKDLQGALNGGFKQDFETLEIEKVIKTTYKE